MKTYKFTEVLEALASEPYSHDYKSLKTGMHLTVNSEAHVEYTDGHHVYSLPIDEVRSEWRLIGEPQTQSHDLLKKVAREVDKLKKRLKKLEDND